MLWNTIQPILIGAATGLGAAFLAYTKNIPKGETLNWRKLMPLLTIGTLSGLYAVLKGIDMTTAQSIIGTGGIAYVINYLWSAVWKFITNKRERGKFIIN